MTRTIGLAALTRPEVVQDVDPATLRTIATDIVTRRFQRQQIPEPFLRAFEE